MSLGPFKNKSVRVEVNGTLITVAELTGLEIIKNERVESKYGYVGVHSNRRHSIGPSFARFSVRRWFKTGTGQTLFYTLNNNGIEFTIKQFINQEVEGIYKGIQLNKCKIYSYRLITGTPNDIIAEEIIGEAPLWGNVELVPPLVAMEGSYYWNIAKPYYYNGYFYVFFQRVVGNTAYLYHARSNGITWSEPILITSGLERFIFGSMGIDDKIVCVWSSEPFGDEVHSYQKSLLGTIQTNGSVTWGSIVAIFAGLYSITSGVRAIKIGGVRKYFTINSSNGSGSSTAYDHLWISDDDCATWVYKGAILSFSSYFWWSQRMIPFEDGNKFIEIHSPHSGITDNYNIYALYRDPTSSGSETWLGTFVNQWYIDSKGEGCYLNDYVYISWIDNLKNVRHKRTYKTTPSIWVDLGNVDVLIGTNLNTSPVTDVINGLIYIFYSDDNNIYYKVWSGSSYGSKVTFYSTSNTINNLCVHPISLNGKIIIAWNEYISGVWNVKCSTIIL